MHKTIYLIYALSVLIVSTSCGNWHATQNLSIIHPGMTIAQVDSILGPASYITEGDMDTMVIFRYNYTNMVGSSSDAYVAFDADSTVVRTGDGTE